MPLSDRSRLISKISSPGAMRRRCASRTALGRTRDSNTWVLSGRGLYGAAFGEQPERRTHGHAGYVVAFGEDPFGRETVAGARASARLVWT